MILVVNITLDEGMRRSMNEFGRFMGDFNKSLEQMMQTMSHMQTLFKTFKQMSPLLKGMSGIFVAPEEPSVMVSRTKTGKHKIRKVRKSRNYR